MGAYGAKAKGWLRFERMDGSVAVLLRNAGDFDGWHRSRTSTTLTDYLVEAAIILAVAGVMFGPILVVKWLTIRRSKQRTLAADATAAHIPGILAGGPSGIVSR